LNSNENPFSENPHDPPFVSDSLKMMPPGLTQPGSPITARSSQPSTLAVVCLVMAAISPFLICCCNLSLLTSTTAILLGHIALIQISRSDGALSEKGLARIGLAMGYVILISNVGILAFAFLYTPQQQPVAKSSSAKTIAADTLRDAELKIIGDSAGVAHGNTPEAKILAERFAVRMKELRDIAFTESTNKIQLTGGNFVTYCELHPEKCAFLVHVPSYRNFEEDAKTTLAEIAWSVAQETVADSMVPGDRLAVGLKGTLLYGAVMTGTVSSEESKPAKQTTEKDLLESFFERPAEKPPAELTPESPAESPATPAEPK
jgi:hypothetical protein